MISTTIISSIRVKPRAAGVWFMACGWCKKWAQGCLLELAQFAERFYTTNMSYLGLALPATQCRNDLAVFYTFSLNGTPDARSYSIQAVAQGSQATRDPNCVTLRINQTGAQTSLPAAAGCW